MGFGDGILKLHEVPKSGSAEGSPIYNYHLILQILLVAYVTTN